MTKFYVEKTPCCSFCGAKRDTILIGHSAHGTTFTFRTDPERGLTTPAKWLAFLSGKRIVDENGHESDLAWLFGYSTIGMELEAA